ncbi:hypothetical protein U5B43_08210 [Campylobacter sp. 9BO]|uniref:hypothetical protein n=1 Tax=Campylobacter sp. 9BO TaxID=3424759 RepID=UPI003D342585
MKIFKFFPILLCFVLCVNADFISEDTPIMQNGKEIGKILVLTPVEVLKTNTDKTLIKVKGAVLQNYLGAMQKSMSNAEIYINYNTEDTKNFKVLKDIEDDYGEIWHESEGEYEVSTSAITKDTKELNKKASELYEANCSACHRLHEPNAFTAAQWPANLQSMIDIGYVAIEPSDLSLITKFLQQNAKTNE